MSQPARLAQLVVCRLAFGGLQVSVPDYGPFFHQLSVSGEIMNAVYWLTPDVKSLSRNCVVRIKHN